MHLKQRSIAVLSLALLGIFISIELITSHSSVAAAEYQGDIAQTEAGQGQSAVQDVANCRYGVTPVGGDRDVQAELIGELGAGWWLNFGVRPFGPDAANDAEFVHLIRVHQNKTPAGDYLPTWHSEPSMDDPEFDDLISDNPNDIWLLANEIDRGPQPGETQSRQGDMFPDVYARAYHDLYHFIKANDPTARIANAGLVQITPGRLQYLDMMWDAYLEQYGTIMPVDIWNTHLYPLPEVHADGITPNGIGNVAVGTDPALGRRMSGGNPALCPQDAVYCYAEHDDMDVFDQQVTDMRRWMKDHGEQNKPLIITEYSILYPYETSTGTCQIKDEFGQCFTPQRVADYLRNSFDYVRDTKDPDLGYPLDDGRLVQQILWFAIHTQFEGSSSNLYESDLSTLTPIGEAFQQRTHADPPLNNLVIDQVPPSVASIDNTGKANATLSVQFRSTGNQAINQPFVVTFYADEQRTNPIGSQVVDEAVYGCATHLYEVEVSWPGLSPGIHPFWVFVDSGNDIVETPNNNNDNIAEGAVIINSKRTLIPLINSQD